MANECKYQKKQYQISYDDGSTWYDAVPARYEKGNIIEYSSPDCTGIETQYRWRELEGQYICLDKDKYTKEVQEESYDNGATWYVSYPTVYREGEFVGYDEEYCSFKFKGHYVETDDPSMDKHGCPKWYKWDGFKCVYVDPLKIVKCNNNNTLTRSEILYYVPNYTIISAEIGDCATSIGDNTFSGTTLSRLNSNTNGVFNIPNNIINIGSNAFNYCSGITSITIPDNVTSIGYGVFGNCSGLTNATIGNGITSISTSAFRSCTRLRNIDIPDSVTSIGERSFYGCSSLSACTLGTGLASIGQSGFSNCTSLASITIPDSTTNIGNSAFRNCSALTNATIGNGVTSIGNSAFYECRSLTSCTIGSGVTSIDDYAFNRCSGLTSITIEATTPPELLGYYVFDYTNNCPICVPTCNLVNVYKTTGVWSRYASRITSLDCMPLTGKFNVTDTLHSTRIMNQTSGFSAIEIDGVLQAVTYAYTFSTEGEHTINYILSDQTSIGGDSAFTYCENLTSITIPDSVTSIGKRDFLGCTGLTSVNIGSGVTSIGEYAFYHCSGLTSVNIPDSVVTIGNYAFNDCNGLTSVNIGSGVTSIGEWSFTYCTNLTSCTIGNSVTSIGGNAFYLCSGLTSVNIPDSVTSIGGNAFLSCRSLTSITIPDSVTSIDYGAFFGCSSLTSITINATTPPRLGGDDVFDATNDCPIYVPCEHLMTYRAAYRWSEYANRIYGIPPCEDPKKLRLFYSNGDEYSSNCTSTEDRITSSDIRPSGYDYTAITGVVIGNCVTYIDSNAFDGRNSILSVNIPDSVTSIGTRAFRDCSGLTSVTIPSGVTWIGNNAFQNSSSLTSITVNATTPPSGVYKAFDNTNDCPIYVPAASVDAYNASSSWWKYSSRIQAIP